MRYEIEMIDVKAADAFLIHYMEDNGESHIIMVDSETMKMQRKF